MHHTRWYPRAPAGCALVSALLLCCVLPPLLSAQSDTVDVKQLARVLRGEDTADPSAYATPALAAFVARAAEANRLLPDLLESYRVQVESEVSIVQGEANGREVALQVEQVASDVLWRKDTPLIQRVVGYRARTLGLVPSVLSMFDVPWVVPALFGDRIDLVRWSAPTRDAQGRVLRQRAVHPLGADRDSVYRFSGGDTVLVIHLPDREIPLVRVEVTPARLPDRATVLFEGSLDIDAVRHQIVRMRGRMLVADPTPSLEERILGAAFQGVMYVEFESAEYDQRFWLPRFQRIEIQAISRVSDSRVALRVVSRFGVPDLNVPDAASDTVPPPGGLLVLGDVLRESDFEDWSSQVGELTGEVHGEDFRDLEAPTARSASGGRVRFGVRHFSQLVRFNDPEGLFTGGGLTWAPGSAWKRGRVRVHGGWAWAEETVRGGVEVSHQVATWEWLVRAERELRSAGDFGLAYGRDVGAPPLFAGEGELLYDRRTAGLVARQPRGGGWAWRVEAARSEDRRVRLPADSAATRGPLLAGLVAEGGYWTGRVTLERNAGLLGFGVVPGTALRFDAEGATGELDWLRLEAGVSARGLAGALAVEARLDGGITISKNPPPQRLLELGRSSGLPGYPVRAFAGDRIALAQAAVSYTLPLLDRPFGVGGFYLPALAPAPTVILRAGWTGTR